MPTSSPLVFAAGLLLGALLAWLALRGRGAGAAAEVRAGRARLDEAREALRGREADLADLREETARLRAQGAALAARADEARRAADERQALLESAERRLSEAFSALSADALRRNNRAFVELATETMERFHERARGDLDARRGEIDAVVAPLRDSLQRVDAHLRTAERERAGAYAALSEQVRGLMEAQGELARQAGSLAAAMRTPQARGRWGEVQLRRVVEMAGMSSFCDFDEQATGDGDGRLRPDLVVRLPGGRSVVVDAKAPLDAYLRAQEAPDEAARGRLLREHARRVRAHVARLAAKAYWTQFSPSPEFVVLFLPGEAFFGAALEHDAGLIEAGAERGVVLATPTTLVALLRAVAYGWRQAQAAENARAVTEAGRELYARARTVAGHFDDLRKHLERAVGAYNRAAGSLETRLLAGARRLRDLGAGEGDDIGEAATVDVSARTLSSITPAADGAGRTAVEAGDD